MSPSKMHTVSKKPYLMPEGEGEDDRHQSHYFFRFFVYFRVRKRWDSHTRTAPSLATLLAGMHIIAVAIDCCHHPRRV